MLIRLSFVEQVELIWKLGLQEISKTLAALKQRSTGRLESICFEKEPTEASPSIHRECSTYDAFHDEM